MVRLAGGVVFLLAGCALQLSGPPGPPAHNPVGLWWMSVEPGEPMTVLQIHSEPEDKHEPYRFRLVRYLQKDLVLSGKLAHVTLREGAIRSSARELLLVQNRYADYRQANHHQPQRMVWPPDAYEPPLTERETRTSYALALLFFEKDGNVLTDGDELRFTRLGTDADDVPIAVVLAVDDSNAMALVACPTRPAPRTLRTGDNRALRVLGTELERLTVTLPGPLKVGQPLYRGEGAGPQRARRLSKAEVLRRLRRGEKVSREDLIRVLGPQADQPKSKRRRR